MSPNRPRYVVRKARGGWYVEDTLTGAVWMGLAHVGAAALADHLNRRPRSAAAPTT